MTIDVIKVTGKLQILVIDKDGNLKQELNVPNLVVNTGKTFIVSRMNTSPPTAMSHMALGSNDIQTAPEMTTLASEVLSNGDTGSKIRSSFDSVVVDPNFNSITYSATFPSGYPSVDYVIREAGIFNSASNGTMLARTAFPPVSKSASDAIVINWKIIIN